MAQERNKRLVFNILQFLQDSIADGTVRVDDAEGIEVASQCISEAFGVELDKDTDKRAYSISPETLSSVLESHCTAAKSKAPVAAVAPPAVATAEVKALAEKAKSLGNQKMASKDYDAAIAAYGQAIAHDASNPVYWSNRAAAHSQGGDHASAIEDANKAIELDPKFSKGYSRLGHALYSSGDYAEAVDAYEQGLLVDPQNQTMKSSLATARSRVPAAVESDDEDDSAAAVSSTRGAGAPAGMPGMPAGFPGLGGMDLGSLMSNPAIMNMAQQMMAGGGMEQMMNNPMIRQMMAGAAGGGGMPDMAALMNDPMMRDMAARMGGLGRGGSDTNDGQDGPDNMYS